MRETYYGMCFIAESTHESDFCIENKRAPGWVHRAHERGKSPQKEVHGI